MTFLVSSAACSGSFVSARANREPRPVRSDLPGVRGAVASQHVRTEVKDAWLKKDEDSSDGAEAPDEEPLPPEEGQG